jgi:hypothetical protein
MKNERSKTILVLLSVVLFCCQNRKDKLDTPASKSEIKSNVLIADTIRLFRSNGTLAPESQFQLEWIVVKNQITYFDKKGDDPGVHTRIKIQPFDWSNLSRFDSNPNLPTDTQQQDGEDQSSIEFSVNGKIYAYPIQSFEEKVALIEQLTQQHFSSKK